MLYIVGNPSGKVSKNILSIFVFFITELKVVDDKNIFKVSGNIPTTNWFGQNIIVRWFLKTFLNLENNFFPQFLTYHCKNERRRRGTLRRPKLLMLRIEKKCRMNHNVKWALHCHCILFSSKDCKERPICLQFSSRFYNLHSMTVFFVEEISFHFYFLYYIVVLYTQSKAFLFEPKALFFTPWWVFWCHLPLKNQSLRSCSVFPPQEDKRKPYDVIFLLRTLPMQCPNDTHTYCMPKIVWIGPLKKYLVKGPQLRDLNQILRAQWFRRRSSRNRERFRDTCALCFCSQPHMLQYEQLLLLLSFCTRTTNLGFFAKKGEKHCTQMPLW